MSEIFSNIKLGFVSLVTVFLTLFSPAPISYTTPQPPVATTTIVAVKKAEIETTLTIPAPKKQDVSEAPPETQETSENKLPPVTPSPTPEPAPQPTPQPVTLSWDSVNTRAREATINILCTSVSGGLFNPVSGSGVIIDPRGIILTNAHLAQYLLLADYPAKNSLQCIIRQGSPATPLYYATLMYISPTWVGDHHQEILTSNPLSTGENDFALLLIGESTNSQGKRPEVFPYLNLSFIETSGIVGHPIIITAYPAGFLGGISIQKNLFLTSAPATIHEIYTFTEQTIDLLSLGGSVASQQGSSGGAVVNAEGRLLGIVVTSSEGTTTAQRDLRAITLSHINRVLQKESGISLFQLLAQNPFSLAEIFIKEKAPEFSALFFSKLNDSSSN